MWLSVSHVFKQCIKCVRQEKNIGRDAVPTLTQHWLIFACLLSWMWPVPWAKCMTTQPEVSSAGQYSWWSRVGCVSHDCACVYYDSGTWPDRHHSANTRRKLYGNDWPVSQTMVQHQANNDATYRARCTSYDPLTCSQAGTYIDFTIGGYFLVVCVCLYVCQLYWQSNERIFCVSSQGTTFACSLWLTL